MHKATFLEGTILYTIRPNGPIMVKAGESGGSDPTRPSMEFVRTYRNGKPQVYLPGPSLKGALRAHAERIGRSLDEPSRQNAHIKNRQDRASYPEKLREAFETLPEPRLPLADNPFGSGKSYTGLDDMEYSSGAALDKFELHKDLEPYRTAIIYRHSPFVSQMFGNTSLASHIRFADAYSDEAQIQIEERNGVAIDRIYGSVAVGPFNYETVVQGEFKTRIDFKNLTVAQLGFLGLLLRDLSEGRIPLGFAKSRGMGHINAELELLELRYPTCSLHKADHSIHALGLDSSFAADQLLGVEHFCAGEAYKQYNFPLARDERLPESLHYQADDFLGVTLQAKGKEQIYAFWRACMPAWRQELAL
jgi:CRISPR/Cas system CSM-associated protein Csm3 (group 7 of RAMP superfamily)